MYSKQQASQIRQEFWTVFGQYMSPVLSAEGEKINWINYKTGEKHVFFKMETEGKTATIAIELSHPDPGVQEVFFDQFMALRTQLEELTHEEWNWQLHHTNQHGQTVSRIYTQMEDVTIFNKEHWPKLISFFKPRLIALDNFWSEVKYFFETLH